MEEPATKRPRVIDLTMAAAQVLPPPGLLPYTGSAIGVPPPPRTTVCGRSGCEQRIGSAHAHRGDRR
jgi:hypothetical protein